MNRAPRFPKFGAGDQRARIEGIAAAAGLDLAAFAARSFAITGSNGKGSTAAMLQSILEQAGRRTGLFTSPHMLDLNERIRIGGADISDTDIDAHWRKVEAVSDAWLASRRDQQLGAFEFLFLVAASAFAEAGCDALVWEAGIGGRHDVTRFARAHLAALVSLDLEHTALLGDTLEQIACDKADIAPDGGTLLLGESVAPFLDLIAAHVAPRGVRVDLARAQDNTPLLGAHQASNAGLAAALAGAGAQAREAAVRAGLAATRWPGRLETIGRDPLIVIDVGHTPRAIEAALAGFRTLVPRGGLLVCGASHDKSAADMIGPLARAFDDIIATRAWHKGARVAEIAAFARAANPGAQVKTAGDVAAAHAHALGDTRGEAIYVAGGHFLAAEFKAVHQGRDPTELVFF